MARISAVRQIPKGSGRWAIDTTVRMPDGERCHLQRKGYKSRGEAESDYDRAVSLFVESRGFSPKEGTFDSLIASFVSHEATKLKPTTVHGEKMLLGKWAGYYFKGKTVPDSYSVKELTQFRSWLLEAAKNHIGTANRVLRDLSRMSEYAFDMGFIGMDSLRAARLQFESVKTNDAPPAPPRTWTHQQYESFMATFDRDDRYVVLFQWLFFSGCRIGEALGLRWGDVDFKNGCVSICRTCSPRCGTGAVEFMTPKSKSGYRKIFLSKEMAENLRLLMKATEGTPESCVFFTGSEPVGRTTVRRVLNSHAKAAKLPRIKIHEIRHTNNTWLLESANGGSMDELKAISDRLGRSSLGVTLDTYFHAKDSTPKELAKKIKI